MRSALLLVRVLDMRLYLGYPAFAPLAEGGLFMKAHVLLGTVAWTDEIDISPDTLYLCGRLLADQSTHRADSETRLS